MLLKQNDVFVVSDPRGDFPRRNDDGFGLYRADCRFLSAYELRLNGQAPVLLSNSVDRAYVATYQLVNPGIGPETKRVPRQTLSLWRKRFLHRGLHERIGLKNCSRAPVDVELELRFDADFRDIFEVRKYVVLPDLGTKEPLRRTDTGFVIGYEGKDGVHRATQIVLHPTPTLGRGRAVLPLRLAPHGSPKDTFVLVVDIFPLLGDEQPEPDQDFDSSLADLEYHYEVWNRSCTTFKSDNELLDQTLMWRNREDMRVLCDERPTGLLPTAGIPWYAVPFGRDAIITSVQSLALNPELAIGSLRYLAQHQGKEVNPYREEEPGKILHEIRFGELANLGKIPHTPYYGTVDATPLFLALMVELVQWTGDLDFCSELWDNAEAALQWIDRYGDLDGDGFVEYAARLDHGIRLKNRGWKDSDDSLLHEDGREPSPPIALVEVQGYVYQAKAGLARILRRLGRTQRAEELEEQALRLYRSFNDRFWMEDEKFYAQGLDGQKCQVSSITSNPGHCLWSGAITPERAAHVVRRLLQEDMFSGWGVRTLSEASTRSNPMSYHNGSIWPHDNSLIAAGMRRYGFNREAERIARSVLHACMRFPDDRIPELFCGFKRDRTFNSAPAEYLVSCSPQAWGAGSLFQFLQTLIGVEADMLNHRLRIDPVETSLFTLLRVEGMRVADGELDFTIRYPGGRPQVQVDRKPPAVKQLELPS